MIHKSKKLWLHLFVWLMLFLYLLSANTIYTSVFLKNGKPVARQMPLPQETQEISYDFSPGEQVRYDGQDLYHIHGYALHSAIAPKDYHIKIVLQSPVENIVFDTDVSPFQTLLKTRPDFVKDSMYLAEYDTYFSKNVLKPGNYEVGILIEDPAGRLLAYQPAGVFVERTPNQIRFTGKGIANNR